jgi:hypothetical protein
MTYTSFKSACLALVTSTPELSFVKRLTGDQLEARLDALDTPAHRLMASAVGGAGTLVGVGLAGAYEMNRHRLLRLRYPNVLWFALMIAAMGTAGGGVGHYLVVRAAQGSMEKRALSCGGSVGFVTALGAWALTFYGQRVLSPFKLNPQADRVIRDALKIACFAGPVAGISVSLLVLEVLKRLLYSNASLPATRGTELYRLNKPAGQARD